MIRGLFWFSLLGVAIGSLMPVTMLPPQAFDIWDKAQHALAFAWLAGLGLLSYPAHAPRVVVALWLYGGAIELAQTATGWRFGEWADLAADTVGIAFATTAWRLRRPRKAAHS